jgi:hypothetical protein
MRLALRVLVCAALIHVTTSDAPANDAGALHGIHWWGYYDYGVIDPQPAVLMNTAANGGWNVEVVNTHGPPWQNPWFYEPLYRDLYQNKNVSLITRVEYEYGKTVPSPATIPTHEWANHVVGLVNTLKDGGRWWQLGNEPNLHLEGQGGPDNRITPAAYADIYRQVRNAVRANAQVGAPGEHKLLLAPVSPGGVIPGVRWMDGNQWLAEAIDAFGENKHEIDGVALHAYGGSVQEFRASIAHQLAVLESRGLSHLPVFITEWNRFANPQAANAAEQDDTEHPCRCRAPHDSIIERVPPLSPPAPQGSAAKCFRLRLILVHRPGTPRPITVHRPARPTGRCGPTRSTCIRHAPAAQLAASASLRANSASSTAPPTGSKMRSTSTPSHHAL